MEELDFEGIETLGKIYHSLTHKKTLTEFFLESSLSILEAESGCLYLCGEKETRLWLESKTAAFAEPSEHCLLHAAEIFKAGKPLLEDPVLYVPLIVSNSPMGLAAFIRPASSSPFQERHLKLAVSLSYQAGSALKNILLFERTVEMEKLSAVGQSMGMVMHEIKNIIQLATFADAWLKKGLESHNPLYLERGAKGIAKALKDMTGFTHEILSLTKNYQITPKAVCLAALLAELKNDMNEKAAALNIRLVVECEEGLEDVECEERSIYRALLNLVKNALEACGKPESWVKVSAASLDSGRYTLTVSDNGEGMTDEVKAKIRTAFFSTKGQNGTGLGVLVVERMLQAHQGTLEIESEEGKGSLFKLTLPKKISPRV